MYIQLKPMAGIRRLSCIDRQAGWKGVNVRKGLSAVSSDSLQIEVVEVPELICILRGLLLSTC